MLTDSSKHLIIAIPVVLNLLAERSQIQTFVRALY